MTQRPFHPRHWEFRVRCVRWVPLPDMPMRSVDAYQMLQLREPLVLGPEQVRRSGCRRQMWMNQRKIARPKLRLHRRVLDQKAIRAMNVGERRRPPDPVDWLGTKCDVDG